MSQVRKRVPRHAVEAILRASVAAVINATGETMTDIGTAIGLSPNGVSRRQQGLIPWTVPEIGHLADHWGIEPCALLAGPSDAVAELDPERVAELRSAKDLPPIPAAMTAAA